MFTSLPSLDPRTVSRGHLRLKKVDNHMFLCVFELKTWDTWVFPHFCPLIHWLFQMCRSLDLFKCRSRSQAFGLLEPGRNSDIGWHDRVSLKPIYHDLPMILCTLRETPGCVWGFSRFPAPALDWWNWKRSKWEAYGRVLHGSVFGSSIDVPWYSNIIKAHKADIFRTAKATAGDHCGLGQRLSSRLAMYQEGLYRSLLEDQEWSCVVSVGVILDPP